MDDMWLNFLLVGFGGAIGATARHGISVLVHRFVDPKAFPVGTLVVNLLGCLAIGVLVAAIFGRVDNPAKWRIFLITGLLGGFTTFSAFAVETTSLIESKRYLAAGAYVGLSVFGCLLMTMAGLKLFRAAV